MSKINSTTLPALIALFKATENNSEFTHIVSNASIFDPKIPKTWDSLLRYLQNGLSSIHDIDVTGWKSSKELNMFGNVVKVINKKNSDGMSQQVFSFLNERTVRPMKYRYTAEDGILRDFYEFSFLQLYPKLISNSIKNGMIKVSYRGNDGFSQIYPVLVENYMEIRRELLPYKNASYIFKFFINWAYGHLGSNSHNYFLFHPDSICPINEFHKEFISIIKDLDIMHYYIDQVFLKTKENVFDFEQAIKQFMLNRGLVGDIEYIEKFEITRGIHRQIYVPADKRKEVKEKYNDKESN